MQAMDQDAITIERKRLHDEAIRALQAIIQHYAEVEKIGVTGFDVHGIDVTTHSDEAPRIQVIGIEPRIWV